jgi:hypothetical protein
VVVVVVQIGTPPLAVVLIHLVLVVLGVVAEEQVVMLILELAALI